MPREFSPSDLSDSSGEEESTAVEEDEEEEEEEEEEEAESSGEEHHTIAHEQEDDEVPLSPIRPGKRKNREDVVNVPPANSLTISDPDVLDCPTCRISLTIPVFQCQNGHTTCSSCCSKLRNKCPSCSFPIGYIRCRAIEKVLESIKISCQNLKYGCKETVTYDMKREHEQRCLHEACSCPHPGCDFVGSSRQLYLHFDCKHTDSATAFRCDSFFNITIKTNAKFVILQERVGRTLFILNYGVKSIGNMASITCVAPSSLRKGFSYELVARRGDDSVKLESFTQSMPRWSQHLPEKTFLLVPRDFFGSSGMHDFQVRIRRNNKIPDKTPNT